MRIPVLVSRSGFTAWGVELAQKANLTLIGRARGRRFVALAGLERLLLDADPRGGDEDRRHVRKGSLADAGD
jgi:FdhD protein